jgi:hypothetical protein
MYAAPDNTAESTMARASGNVGHGSTRRARLAWLLVAAYFVATSLGHLEFSLWLVRQRSLGSVTFAFKEAMPWLAIAGGAALVAWVLRQLRRNRQARGPLAAFWLAWGICVALSDRFLTYSVNEYAHYPQYALLAWLIAKALDPERNRCLPGRVMFWTTLLGMLDETQQYIWIAPSYGHYLDFNDFLVNLLAGAVGTMCYYTAGPLRARAQSHAASPRIEVRTAVALALVLTIGFASGFLKLSPPEGLSLAPGGWVPSGSGFGTLFLQRASFWYQSWQTGPYHGTYLILSPWWGMPLMAVAGTVFTALAHMVLRAQAKSPVS